MKPIAKTPTNIKSHNEVTEAVMPKQYKMWVIVRVGHLCELWNTTTQMINPVQGGFEHVLRIFHTRKAAVEYKRKMEEDDLIDTTTQTYRIVRMAYVL